MCIDVSRLLIYRAVTRAALVLPSVRDGSIAKFFANENTRKVCSAALQLLAGYGYNTEDPIEQRLRDAGVWGIAGGAMDTQKVNIAAALVNRRFYQRH